MSQLSLFTSAPDLSHTLARRSDPATSHQAAEQKVSSGSASSDRERILAVLREAGDELTGGEIAEAINRELRAGEKPWTNVRVVRRTGELERQGLIVKTGERVCRSMGTNQGAYMVSKRS